MTNTDELKKTVDEAYAAVASLTEEKFKLEGFKLVLTTLLSGHPMIPPVHSMSSSVAVAITPKASAFEANDWQVAISNNLGISVDDVAQLFYLESDESLRLVLDMKYFPKSSSALATKQIAMLISAGRQAAKAKFDKSGTSFDVIRKECDQYNVLNKSNFTSYLKQLKPKFLTEGKGIDQSIRVTPQGFVEAGNVAKKYLGQTQE